jgi:hypothetical protein
MTKQFEGGDCMAPGGGGKEVLGARPHALLRSTLTAPPSAKSRRLGIAFEGIAFNLSCVADVPSGELSRRLRQHR